MKNIKEMTLTELRVESDELWTYLHMTKETSSFDDFEYNGLDYWDSDRRHHQISQEVVLRTILETSK